MSVIVSYFSLKAPIRKIAEAIEIGALQKHKKGKKRALYICYVVMLKILLLLGNLRSMKKYEAAAL